MISGFGLLVLGFLCALVVAGGYILVVVATEAIDARHNYVEPIKTFDLGYQDGKNETYNPQPGRWKPDYDEGYKLGIIARSCNCPCEVQS